MALRTQLDPNHLIGDTIADRPLPGSMKQGNTFYAVDTGDSWILVIDPLTNVRSWDVVAIGGSGATAGDDHELMPGFLLNATVVTTVPAPLTTFNQARQVAPRAGSITAITADIAKTDANSVTFQATLNGVLVPGAFVTLPPNAIVGVAHFAPGTFPFASGDRLGLEVFSSGTTSALTMLAAIEIGV